MASTTVMKHVLQKISIATQLEEAVSVDERIAYMKEALIRFEAQVTVLQEMADHGIETGKQKEWRNRVVGLACQIEDFLDSSNHSLEDLNLFCCYRRQLKKAVMRMYNEICREITELSQEQTEFNNGASTPESYGFAGIDYDPWLSLPAAQTSGLPGVRQAREKVARLLLDGKEHLKGVSIVGSAGTGKTALAVEVYHQVKTEFECSATATVSRKPDMKQFLQHILSQVRQETPECSEASLDRPKAPGCSEEASPELEQLIKEIGQQLQYKRYLILLDDVWESPSEIMSTLPKNKCGSRIIMTTRIKSLADLGLCGCDATEYEMESLGDDTVFFNDCQRIMLSYSELDPFLKTHMMLLCMFPQKYLIQKYLIRILRAEGYANSSLGESEAENILEQLIDRSVILPLNHKDISQVEAWRVYYAMFEAIRLRSAEDAFLISSSMPQLTRRSKVRRLALHSYCQAVHFRRWLRNLDLSFVSSLSILSEANKVYLYKFIHLRVLDIMGWEHLKNNDMKHICRMLLLRYLSIRNTRVSWIPWMIINLRHLETLDVRKTRVRQLPREVGLLPKLSDLLVGGDQDLSYNTRVKIATGFRYFGSLKTLETIHLIDAWPLLGSLQHLAEVKILCPFREASYSQNKLLQSLKQCRGLESLTFYASPGCCMEFLHSLNDPPNNLRKLTVTGRFVTIPPWIATLENLVLLQIKVCQLRPDDLQKLSELPVLQSLLLGLDFLPEQEMVINGFPALERFSIDCQVPWMIFQPGAMPKLSQLELKFREGPANQDSAPSGISHLLNLKRIAIYYSSWCHYSLSVRTIVEAMVIAVRDHSGPVKLVINGCCI